MLNVEQKSQALEAVSAMTREGARIDAMTVTRRVNQVGNRVDWHETADYLDELLSKGIVRRSTTRGYDGFTVYELAR